MRIEILRQSWWRHLLTALLLLGFMGWPARGQAQDHPVTLLLEDEQQQPVADVKVWVVTANLGSFTQNHATELSKGTTGADGRARVIITDVWMGTPPALRQELAFICYKPGYNIASLAIWRDSPLQDAELVLTLRKATSTTVEVRTPDDHVVTKGTVKVAALAVDTMRAGIDEKTASAQAAQRGGRVRKFSWGFAFGQTPMWLPEELHQKLIYQLDANGRVTVEGIDADSFGMVEVDTEAFGEQIHFRNVYANPEKKPAKEPWPDLIRLSPVGKIAGTIVSAPAGLQVGRTIVFSTRPANTAFATQPLVVFGSARVPLMADGKFEVSAIATGECDWKLVPVRDPKAVILNAVTAMAPTVLRVSGGKTTEVEVKLGPGIPVRGVVVDSVTDKPVANTVVMGIHNLQYESVQTDKDGKYQFLCAPGQVAVMAGAPQGYFPKLRVTDYSSALFQILPTQTEFVVPPIKLDPAVTCTGVAFDEQNKPIANADIHASWKGRNRRSDQASWGQLTVKTNDKGEFQINGLDPGECWIWGEFNGQFSDKTIAVTPKNFQNLKMSIGPNNQVIFKGKLTDSEGHAVSHAAIEISGRLPGDPSNPAVAVSVKADSIKVDPNGVFELMPLAPHYEYQFILKAANCVPLTLAWNVPKGSGSQDLGDVVLKVVGSVAGLIVDQQGKPIANAKVISLTAKVRLESTSADDGSFRFDATEKEGFLIVDHPDFRCTGRPLNQLQQGVRVVLVRRSEPVAERFELQTNGVNAEQQRKLADQLLEPFLKPGSKVPDQQRMQALKAKADWDPLGALESLEAAKIQSGQMADHVRGEIAKALSRDNVDASLELMGTIKDDAAVAMVLKSLAQSPKIPLEKKRQLLADGYVRVKAMKAPEFRVCFQGFIAEALWDLGEKQQAEIVLKDGLEFAKKLPVSEFAGYARGCFAEELAAMDLPAALELIKDLKDPFEFDRHHANIAQELADRNPAEAQRVLNMLKPVDPAGNRFDGRSTYAIRICHRMALVDLPRAIAIADSLEDQYARAQCYGIIADALATKDKTKASELIDKAFQVLHARIGKSRERLTSPYTSGQSAGGLLPTIEKLDPQLIPESIWRCLTLIEPIIDDPQNVYWTTEDKWQLAMFIGIYDVSIAKTIVGWLETTVKESFSRNKLQALIIVDPVGESARIEAEKPSDQANRDRISAAKILGRQGADRVREIRHAAGLWNTDVEDIE